MVNLQSQNALIYQRTPLFRTPHFKDRPDATISVPGSASISFAEEGLETFEAATDRAAAVAPLHALSSAQ
jgi:hypothetical protein